MTVYAVCRTGKGANTFVAHSDVREARNAGNGFHIVKTKKDLSDKRIFPTSFLVDIYNKNASKNITKFRDRATAEKKVFEILTQHPVEKNNNASANKKRIFNGKIIRVTTRGKNPRREGTHAFDSMQILLDHNGPMQYEDFIEAGGRRPDFYYDLKHNWVKLSG